MEWIVEFYETGKGHCPVREFLDGLPERPRAKVIALIMKLQEHGPTLPFPYSSQVEGKIRELRTQYGKENFRILYFGTPSRNYVLLHAFIKRSEKIPESEIRTAKTRMNDYLSRKRRKNYGPEKTD